MFKKRILYPPFEVLKLLYPSKGAVIAEPVRGPIVMAYILSPADDLYETKTKDLYFTNHRRTLMYNHRRHLSVFIFKR